MNEEQQKQYNENRLTEEPERTILLIECCGFTEEETKEFRLKVMNHSNNDFNLALNRVFSFLELSDKEKVYDNIKVFWLLAMCEIVIKATNNRFDDSKESSKDVKTFFDKINDESRSIITEGLKLSNPEMLGKDLSYFCRNKDLHFEFLVNLFLDVRHRVVHGKMLYNFSFFEKSKFLAEQKSALYTIFTKVFDKEQSFVLDVSLSYIEFRKILVAEAVKRINERL